MRLNAFCTGLLLVFVSVLKQGFGLECYKSVFGSRITFDCPTILHRKDEMFCCADGDSQKCCSNPLDDEMVMKEISLHDNGNEILNPYASDDHPSAHSPQIDDARMALGSILATVAAVIGAILVICCLCCFCCPFCVLYKRRQRGAVYRTAVPAQPNVTVTLQPNYPPQQQQLMQQQHIPQQQVAYPPYPQPPLSQQPPGTYPSMPMPQPYPGEQPPPYPGAEEQSKQSAFNPYYK